MRARSAAVQRGSVGDGLHHDVLVFGFACGRLRLAEVAERRRGAGSDDVEGPVMQA